MSSLQAIIEELFQLYLEFLNPNVVVLGNSHLLVKIKHIKNDNSSLKVYL